MTVKELMERLQTLSGDETLVWDESEDEIMFVTVRTTKVWDEAVSGWVGKTVVAFE